MNIFRDALVFLGLCMPLGLHATPYAYVPHQNGLSIVDLLNRVVREIPGTGAGDVAIDTPANRAYAVHHDRLAVIDIAAQAEIANVPLATRGITVTLRPSHPEAWVITEPCPPGTAFTTCQPGLDTIARIVRTDTNAEAGSLVLPKSYNLAFSADGNTLFAASFDKLHVMDLRTRPFTESTIYIGNNSFSFVVVDRLSRFAYVSEDGQGAFGSTVAVVDLQARAVVGRITVGRIPGGMVLNAAGTRLYVVNTESGSVSVIDTGTRTVIGTIRLNCRPFAADLNASEDQLVVICHNNDNVALVDTGTLQMTGTVPVGPSPIATGRFIAATSAPRLPDVLTGLWWNPAEPGWGVHVSHRGNRMFAAWFTYDGSGRPKWYVSSDCVMNSQLPTPPAQGEATCTGSVYETAGPRFFSDPYNPGGVSVTRLGLFQMGFSDRDKGAMSVVIGTTAKTVALRRQAFASGNLPATDYTDLWWNPSESGWGIGITQQASTMFVAWFAYDDTGTAQWYVASNCAVNAPGNGCAGALYRTSGPIDPLRNAFDPSRVKVTAVGSICVSFTDANTGSISYEVDGKAGTKSITRQPF